MPKVISLGKLNKPWQEVTADELGGRRENGVLIIRYGGFGDMIMMSSVLPALKSQYRHVTVNTGDNGVNVIRHDPHINDILHQPNHWVPMNCLDDWFKKLSPLYDRVINLCESIEGNLLAIGPRTENVRLPDGKVERQRIEARESFWWPHDKRHALLNRNYTEETHRIAGVALTQPNTRFYPSDRERAKAKRRAKKMRQGGRLILWVLSGSSVHKSYPWTDFAMGQILRESPNAVVVLVGDGLCQMLEAGWESQPRVIRRSGKWSIRETLAFAQLCDVVVGPETGVLNAVSMIDSVKKIVMLSHSSHDNLTRDWVNTVALTPTKVDCYPCHRMHYGRDHCAIDESTHAAQCAADISPEEVVAHVLDKPTRHIFVPVEARHEHLPAAGPGSP